MSPTRFLTILRRHLWHLLLAALVCGGTTAFLVKDLPARYKATSQVIIDINASTSGTGAELSPFIIDKYIATQVDILSSQAVALRVVDEMRLAGEPGASATGSQEQAQAKADAKALREQIASNLRERIEVKPGRDSSVLTITAAATDPVEARDLANAWAMQYLAETIDMRVNPAKQSSVFLHAEAEKLRVALELAQDKVADFQRAKGLTSSDERLDVESVRLAELTSELTRTEAQRIDASNRRSVADDAARRSAGADLPSVQQDALIQTLRSTIATLEGRRRERAAVLGENHPELLKIHEELESAQAQLKEATASLTRGIKLTQRITTQREAELAAAVARQRNKVVELREVRDELVLLQRDQEAARKAYDDLRERMNAQTLESRSTLTSASLLSEATLPPEPLKLMSVLKVVASAVLAMVLTAGLAIAWDLVAPRIQGRSDLEGLMGDGPVIRVRRAGRKNFQSRAEPDKTTPVGRPLSIGFSGNVEANG